MKNRGILGYIPVMAGACLLLAVVLLTAGTNPAAADLPPRPTKALPTDTPTPGGGAKTESGGQLVLSLLFDVDWPWEEVGWQQVWTVMQWQDPFTGEWHDVEGWQGHLDSVKLTGDGVVGSKGWWVSQDDLETGPFRWQVFDGKGGALVGQSDPFNLPGNHGKVEVQVNGVAP